jgi:hypothetical protein
MRTISGPCHWGSLAETEFTKNSISALGIAFGAEWKAKIPDWEIREGAV